VVAFTRSVPARHGGTRLVPPAAADLLRPSAEEAWPYVRASGAPCRALGWRLRAPCPAPPSTASGLRRLPRGAPHAGHLPPRQARRCRRRFRTTTTGRTRTPSLGSTRTLRPERTRLRSLFTCSASSRTRSLAASLGLPRQRPTGRFELSGVFTSPRGSRLAAPQRTGKMRLTDFCNRLPSRAPCGLLGSWLRPLPRSTSRCLVAPRVPCGPRRRCAGSPWALTRRWRGSGALPVRLPDEPTKWSFAWRRTSCFDIAAIVAWSPKGAPEGARYGSWSRTLTWAAQHGPGGVTIADPSALHHPAAVFSTARRACDAASDALCRDPPRIRPWDRVPVASDRQAQLPPPSRQRRRLSPDQDAFHRRVLPPPVARRAFAQYAWDLEEPATGVAALVLVAFATATRLPARFRSLSCHPLSRVSCHPLSRMEPRG